MTDVNWSVVLVGAGELGSRHLQSLATLSNTRIDIVEPAASALFVARQRLEQVAVKAEIRFYSSITQLEIEYDVAIVATGSGIRFELTRQLLQQAQLKFLILEKVLFQKPQHYEQMQNLLEKSNVQAFVNCPRRLFPLYQQLKASLKPASIQISVRGNLWGMACNSIHFFDLLAFLSNETLVSVNGSRLSRFFPSKRPGYFEVEGEILAIFSRGSELRLQCTADNQQPLALEVGCCYDGTYFKFDEQKGLVENMTDGCMLLQGLPVLYQSQMTATVVSELMLDGDCHLTTYRESTALHLPLLNALLHFFRKEQPLLDACPIT